MSYDGYIWFYSYLYPGGIVMTAILGFIHDDKAYIAGERGTSDDSNIMNSITKKVYNIGPYIYGYAGCIGIGQYIKSGFDFPTPPEGMDIHEFLTSTFLVALRKTLNNSGMDMNDEENGVEIILGYQNRIFEISTSDYQCSEYDHTAIGSGREYSLGAYHVLRYIYSDPIYIANRCIEAAILYSPSCSGKIDIIST